MLDDFCDGKMNVEYWKKSWFFCQEIDGSPIRIEECLPIIHGDILNVSMTYQDLGRSQSYSVEEPDVDVANFFFSWYMLSQQKKLLVKAAGNQGLYAGSGFMFMLMKSLTRHPSTREEIIIVSNLEIDGLHSSPSALLPGKHAGLQRRTVSAIKTRIEGLSNYPQDEVTTLTWSGSSIAAPFVSAAAAIIHGQFPNLTMAEVAHCILDSATPIILLGDMPSFKNPVALDMSSYQFKFPGIYPDVEGRLHNVSYETMEESWATYGRGRIHVERALQLSSLLSAGRELGTLHDLVSRRLYRDLEYELLEFVQALRPVKVENVSEEYPAI